MTVNAIERLAAWMSRGGAEITLRPRASLLEVVSVYGATAPLTVRWRPGDREILVAHPLAVAYDTRDVARAALAIARVNEWLDAPALTLHIATGRIEYRLRLFAESDGAVDLALFDALVDRLLADIDRVVPLLEQALGRDEDGEEDGEAVAFAGYVE